MWGRVKTESGSVVYRCGAELKQKVVVLVLVVVWCTDVGQG